MLPAGIVVPDDLPVIVDAVRLHVLVRVDGSELTCLPKEGDLGGTICSAGYSPQPHRGRLCRKHTLRSRRSN